MPGTFENLGIRFLYPDNWSLDEEDSLDGIKSVTVQSPGGAFWSIALHPLNVDPQQLAEAAHDALRAEYPDSEAERISEQIGGQDIEGFDVSFFYLDFTNTALIRAFRTDRASCLVLCQAEDREFNHLSRVFRAITTSLLSKG